MKAARRRNSNSFRRLFEELDDWRRVGQAVRVMVAALLDAAIDRAAERLVAVPERLGVFLGQHYLVGVAVNEQYRHLRLGERGEIVEGPTLVRERLGVVLEVVCLEKVVPLAGRFGRQFSTGPVSRFAEAVVEVDGERLVRMGNAPRQRIHRPAAHAENAGPGI
ncbi:MAG: hypothetical protein JWM11_4669 [Planctomycetaceae bacterium]|nr:hypothetical protein [Planctomycetaceae bacterium]